MYFQGNSTTLFQRGGGVVLRTAAMGVAVRVAPGNTQLHWVTQILRFYNYKWQIFNER